MATQKLSTARRAPGRRFVGTGHLVGISEAARRLGESRSMGYRLFDSGEVPGLVELPGSQKLVKWPAVEAWLSSAAMT